MWRRNFLRVAGGRIYSVPSGIQNAQVFRVFSSVASQKILAPPMVYISGEEMTRYAGELYLNEWVRPYVDISKWEFFDLSCVNRDRTEDAVLRECIEAGSRIGAIYKEPTITPTEDQMKEFGLKKAWGSPNGAMRKGWNGISISRDTIHLEGMELGFKKPCLFDRHAVGGEYHASYKTVGPGTLTTLFAPVDGNAVIVNHRKLSDKTSAVVVYDNPYDNVEPMAHHFFSRCLEANVTPYVVTKKTVFKWQETFWQTMKRVFDAHYKQKFLDAGLLAGCRGELQHYLSDVATMNIIRWSDGGWGMCAHNYDGDVLTDEIAEVHRSPGFITSVLNGVRPDGSIIKEFEASHGTVTDMWKAHLRGEDTSLNPLSMMEALIGAMIHSAKLANGPSNLVSFSKKLQACIHAQMCTPGMGTRDLCGAEGLTTEEFVKAVKKRLESQNPADHRAPLEATQVDMMGEARTADLERMREMFDALDVDKNGTLDFKEFVLAMRKLGVTPRKL